MPRSLSEFAKDLRRLPRVVAIRVAEEAAPALTSLSKETFDASEDAYGRSWPAGKKGKRVTLDKTGALKSHLHYVAIGTRLRVALGVAYAKFQIGRRPVFPKQNGDLPDSYVSALMRTAVRVVREELHK